MDNKKLNPRSLLMFLGTQMLKMATITAYKIVEDVGEGTDLENIQPSATQDDFEDTLIFCMFIFTIFGKWRYPEYRDFVSDAMNLSYTFILDNVIGIESVKKFEQKRDKYWRIYYEAISKFQQHNKEVTFGQVIKHLTDFFETHVARKSFKDFKEKIQLHLSLDTLLNQDFQERVDKIVGSNIQRDLKHQDIKNHFDEATLIEQIAPQSNMTRQLNDIIFFIELYYLK